MTGESSSDILKEIEKGFPGATEDQAGAETNPPETKPTETKPAEVKTETGEPAKEQKTAEPGSQKEATPPPHDEIKEATDEDKKDIPAVLPEKEKQNFILNRIRGRKEKQRLAAENAELKAKIAQIEQSRTAPQSTTQSTPQEPELTADKLSEVLRLKAVAQRHLDGFKSPEMTDEKAKEVVRLSNIVTSAVRDEKLLVDIITNAQGGVYGEMSDEILSDAMKLLPLAQVRDKHAQQEQTTRQNALRQQITDLSQKIKSNLDARPKFKEKNSAEYTFAAQWLEKNVGNKQKPGPLFGVAFSNPQNVDWVFEAIENAYKAQGVPQSEAEIARLREIAGKGELPQSGGRSAGGSVTPGSAEDIKAQIEALAPGVTKN